MVCSDFSELKEILEGKGVQVQCDFPGKSLFNMRPSLIRERIQGFTTFLREVVMTETHRHPVELLYL